MVHTRTPNRDQEYYERTLNQLGTIHLVIGFSCTSLQLAQFSNQSILSGSQAGLWCGTFFVTTGAVTIGLAKVKGIYSSLVILTFCFISLFLALTLCSLSWLGAEAASWCQYEWDQCFINRNTTDSWNSYSEGNATDSPDCEDIKNGYCGFSIGIARILHSLLMLLGICQATCTFVLAAVTCNRPNYSSPRTQALPRISISAIAQSTDHETGFAIGPITAWEYPPLDKAALQAQQARDKEATNAEERPPTYDFVVINANALPDPEEITSRL